MSHMPSIDRIDNIKWIFAFSFYINMVFFCSVIIIKQAEIMDQWIDFMRSLQFFRSISFIWNTQTHFMRAMDEFSVFFVFVLLHVLSVCVAIKLQSFAGWILWIHDLSSLEYSSQLDGIGRPYVLDKHPSYESISTPPAPPPFHHPAKVRNCDMNINFTFISIFWNRIFGMSLDRFAMAYVARNNIVIKLSTITSLFRHFTLSLCVSLFLSL